MTMESGWHHLFVKGKMDMKTGRSLARECISVPESLRGTCISSWNGQAPGAVHGLRRREVEALHDGIPLLPWSFRFHQDEKRLE